VPSEPTVRVPVAPGARGVAGSYLALGIEHILLGVDHLLFVFALILLVRGARRLVATVTAFTAAHSLTLVAATLGWVRVPGPPVEAAIALSIAFLAREILRSGEGAAGLAERRPWAVAFVFGLLHGLGFAGALAQVGLPPRAIPVALLFFNVGVEVGQLAFIGAVLGLRAALRPIALRAAEATPLAAYTIGAIAAFWTVERVAGFFG
jgi:hydrogenase/urease accessory protein HupE